MAGPEIVLIVDDDDGFRDAVADLLAEEGLATAMAVNGCQALEMLASGLRPVAILLDLMMPVMNGPAFRQAQLALPEVRSIPVAVMSASGSSRQQVTALFGDVEYLSKPVSASAILGFVARFRSTWPPEEITLPRTVARTPTPTR